MVLSAVFDRNPKLILPHLKELIELLLEKPIHVAITRNIIRILQFCQIPEEFQSVLFDYCLELLEKPKTSIAVKAFSMQILVNLCKLHPELKQELIPVLELELSRNTEKGVQSRGRAMLKKLKLT